MPVPKDMEPEIRYGGKTKFYPIIGANALFDTETGKIRVLSTMPDEDNFGEDQGFHTIYDELEGIKLF